MSVLAILALGAGSSGCKKGSSGAPPDGSAGDLATDKKDASVNCANVAAATKDNSSACSCDKECKSNICADGFCCDSKCDGKCMACNLPSSLGQCTKVPAGGKPTDAAECAMADASSCQLDGTCDGNGGCRLWVKDTACQSGTCDGDGVSAGRVCDGKGSCVLGRAEACFPFSCDPTSNKCEASCTSHCALGQQCVNNSCGKKVNGASCQTGAECVSNFCADNVCCNVACSGSCQSCNQTGSVGRCQLTPPGLPDPSCAAEASSSCGLTGLCDNTGTCTHFPANTTICSEAACVGETMLSSARSCDGQGTCRDAQFLDCSPFKCGAGACNTSCTTDNDCAAGHPCVAVAGSASKQCSGRKKNGLTCAAGPECESENCVDGVCCETACDGACRSCAVQGNLGRCTTVAKGAQDPRAMCADMGQISCGTDGLCDGTGACEKYAVGSKCGDESCTGGAYTPPATCNNLGQCVNPAARTCNPFVCQGSKCVAQCTKDVDCVTDHVCLNGSCGLKPNGADCASGNECQSAHCAQGVCCNSICDGACVSCDLTGSMGICTAVKDGTIDPQAICAATPQSSCGTTGKCQGANCARWPSGTKCKDSACATISTVTPASACNGGGACVTPVDRSCGTFMCAVDACKLACMGDGDCVPPNTCVNGSCGLKADGAPCTGAGQCANGFCTEGVCCDSACSDGTGTIGLCRSCKVSGKVGTCTAVASGAADPKNRCTASSPGAGNCTNDGTCNGAGACRAWSSTTGCRNQSCVGSTQTNSANCDGAGNCMPAVTKDCSPYLCGPTNLSCLTTCTQDTDCVTGQSCLKIMNKCGTKLPNGQACAAPGDCVSGVCSGEGVCCDMACTGSCQSCVLPSKTGTCSNIPLGTSPRVSTFCTPGAPCGNTGKCNGSGGCALADVTVACDVIMSCTNASMSGPASHCDAAGSCAPATPVACMMGYLCQGSSCATTCAGNPAACAAGYTCFAASGQCRMPLALGMKCTAANECASGACVSNGTNSVCCATACADMTCGTKAVCAANGSACQTHSGEMCGAASCSVDAKSSIAAGACDGSGTCSPPAAVPCMTGYLCAGGTCATSCAGNPAACASGFTCLSGQCKPILGLGMKCTAPGECSSGNCVSNGTDTVCCATACADMTCGTKAVCAANGSACQTHAGEACGAAACSADARSSIGAGTCNGMGTCPQAMTPCMPGYLCAGGTCATSCGADASCDLLMGYTCNTTDSQCEILGGILGGLL